MKKDYIHLRRMMNVFQQIILLHFLLRRIVVLQAMALISSSSDIQRIVNASLMRSNSLTSIHSLFPIQLIKREISLNHLYHLIFYSKKNAFTEKCLTTTTVNKTEILYD